MVEILRSRDQTGPLWWRFSSAIVALYSLFALLPPATKLGKGYVFTCVCDAGHGVVSRPTPGGDLQAHTWGVSPGPHPVGVQAQAGGLSQHALRQTLASQETATAVGGTNPTGMHSCYLLLLVRFMDALTSLTLESNFAKTLVPNPGLVLMS